MAIKAASELPFETGRRREVELASILMTSGQAAGLQYAFFAQRVINISHVFLIVVNVLFTFIQWQFAGTDAKSSTPDVVRSGAVIGGGTMGSGIAMAMLNVGISVILIEQQQKFLDAGIERINNLYKGSVRLGKMSQNQAERCLSLLHPSLDYKQLKDVDIVIEAVFENMALKKDIFIKLGAVCKPGALLCTNTSTLDIDEIASGCGRPEDVMGTHFFVPSYYMPLLEVIYGTHTSRQTVASVMAFGQQIRKTPVLVGNCYGFVGNRMMGHYTTEAAYLVEEGSEPLDVDQVIEDFGFPLGPLAVGDLSGIDVGVLIQTEVLKAKGIMLEPGSYPRSIAGVRTSPLPRMLVDNKRLGRKSGCGWYRYERPGSKQPIPDRHFSEMLRTFRMKHDITPRRIPPQEIMERCLYPLINEGFRILEDGIATKPEDIDTIWLMGYGWPRQTGGPMFYANTVGLQRIHDRLEYFHQRHPSSPHLVPCQLLKRLAKKNIPMSAWMQKENSKL